MSVNSVGIYRPQRFSQFKTASMPLEFTNQSRHEASKKVKTAAAVSSFIGMAAVLTLIAKKQGFPVKPSELKNIPVKDWAFFKIAEKGVPNQKLLEIEEKEILGLAAGSVAGGLIGGALFDRKNMKAKVREAITQIAGNVVVPVAFVGGVSRLYKKYEIPIVNAMPQIKDSTKNIVKYINKFLRVVPAAGITAVALVAGIFTGSKITNLINDRFLAQKQERKIKTTDFAPHVDDLCLAVTLMGAKDSPLASTITRTVPLFLAVPGYQVGKAQD